MNFGYEAAVYAQTLWYKIYEDEPMKDVTEKFMIELKKLNGDR